MGMSGQHHASAALNPPGKDPQYSLYRRLGESQSQLDIEARGKVLSFCRGSNLDGPVIKSVARHHTD
jgi:hypothetical protein